jgi:hypothetical protein
MVIKAKMGGMGARQGLGDEMKYLWGWWHKNIM